MNAIGTEKAREKTTMSCTKQTASENNSDIVSNRNLLLLSGYSDALTKVICALNSRIKYD